MDNNFLEAFRQRKMQHLASQFTNLNEVMADEDAVQKGQEANPFDKYEQMKKSEQIQELSEDIEKGNVDVLEFEKADGEFEIEKGVYTDTEENREFNRVGQEIEKSDIMYALSGTMDGIKVSKTGKEIKEQVENVVLPELNTTLATKKNAADEKLKDCGNAPTKDVPTYWTGDVKMNVGYKFYTWDETYVPENTTRIMPTLSASDSEDKKGNVPENDNQAVARREYNDLVNAICNIMVDIKACEILKNLKDGTEYELTPRQVLSLKF